MLSFFFTGNNNEYKNLFLFLFSHLQTNQEKTIVIHTFVRTNKLNSLQHRQERCNACNVPSLAEES